MKGLFGLRGLILRKNQIEDLRDSLRGLVSLEILSINGNRINELKDNLSGLISLQGLDHSEYDVFLASHTPEELDHIYYLTYLEAAKNEEDISGPKYGANNVLVDSERFRRVMIRFYQERAMQDLLEAFVSSYPNQNEIRGKVAGQIYAIHAKEPGFQTDDAEFGMNHMFDDFCVLRKAIWRVKFGSWVLGFCTK